MGMKQTIDVINRMEADGIIGRYAICGAVAASNYVEPALTDDLDIMIAFETTQAQPQSGLITLGPVFSYLKDKGYSEFQKKAVLIEGWPVQLVPVATELEAEALAEAETVDVEINQPTVSVRPRVLRPEYIVATELRVDRARDRNRIIQFLEDEAVDLDSLREVLRRHGLVDHWQAFCARIGIADPCE